MIGSWVGSEGVGEEDRTRWEGILPQCIDRHAAAMNMSALVVINKRYFPCNRIVHREERRAPEMTENHRVQTVLIPYR